LARLINAKPVCCSSTARLANLGLSRWNSAADFFPVTPEIIGGWNPERLCCYAHGTLAQ
jgi:hypothetical protein